jgi:hypothetical protein
MKALKLLSIVLFASSMIAGPLMAAEEKKPCCEATVEAGQKCAHKCCVKAAKAGKVCEKCHPKKADDKK